MAKTAKKALAAADHEILKAKKGQHDITKAAQEALDAADHEILKAHKEKHDITKAAKEALDAADAKLNGKHLLTVQIVVQSQKFLQKHHILMGSYYLSNCVFVESAISSKMSIFSQEKSY